MIPAAWQDWDQEQRGSWTPRPSRERFAAQHLQAVRVGAKTVAALDTVHLSVAAGEFVTLVGPSGCGKSTLFNILVGLSPPDPGGELFIDGKPQAADHLLGRVAFMPQRDLLMPWRTVLDNAILAAEIDGVPRGEARASALAPRSTGSACGLRAPLSRSSSPAACASASR